MLILGIKGPANINKKNINFDLCLSPVPKFPTPIPKNTIYASNIKNITLRASSFKIFF